MQQKLAVEAARRGVVHAAAVNCCERLWEEFERVVVDDEYRHEGLDPAKVIGSMQYAASSCRPDLALVYSGKRFLTNPHRLITNPAMGR